MTIIGAIKQLSFIIESLNSLLAIALILISFLQIRALFYLYTKGSNAWYANLLMEENLKKLAKKYPHL